MVGRHISIFGSKTSGLIFPLGKF